MDVNVYIRRHEIQQQQQLMVYEAEIYNKHYFK
jgi:hypothetical protein